MQNVYKLVNKTVKIKSTNYCKLVLHHNEPTSRLTYKVNWITTE